MTLRITLLLMLVSVLGCASQIERVQTTQPTTEQTQEEQAKKPALQSSSIALDSRSAVASEQRLSSVTSGRCNLDRDLPRTRDAL